MAATTFTEAQEMTMFKIEGLHNHTGKWITLAEDVDDFEIATEQINQFSRGGNAKLNLYGTDTNTDHFSAFRVV